MKKYLPTFLVIVYFLFFGSTVFGEERYYFQAGLGGNFLNDADFSDSTTRAEAEFDVGMLIGAELGYDFGIFRLGAEAAWRFNDTDSIQGGAAGMNAADEISTMSFMVNGYYDIENASGMVPYVCAGAGLALIDLNDFTVVGINFGSDDDSVFAYQIGAGIAFSLHETLMLDLGYRYFATDDPDFDGIESEYACHTIMAGLRLLFP